MFERALGLKSKYCSDELSTENECPLRLRLQRISIFMIVGNLNKSTSDADKEDHCSKVRCVAGRYTMFVVIKTGERLSSIHCVVRLDGKVMAKTSRIHKGECDIRLLGQEVFDLPFYNWMETYDMVAYVAGKVATEPYVVVSNNEIRYKCFPAKKIEEIIIYDGN